MSWEGLVAIYREAADIRREEKQRPLVECPLCGEPLDFRDGIYNCPLGHFRTRKPTQEQ